MRSEWTQYTFDELVTRNQGVNTTTEKVSYSERGFPVIRANNIIAYSIDASNLVYIDNETFERIKKPCKPQINDILYTNIGSQLGNAAKVKINYDFIIAWNVLRLQVNELIDSDFMVYTLNSRYYKKYIRSLNSSSTMPFVSGTVLGKIKFNIPPLPTQKKISHILTTLDDKIELNRKMNQTLEEMAQVLFKSWFVDFDPVHAKAGCKSDAELEQAAAALGVSKEVLELFPSAFVESEMGMIPEGWEVSTIEDEVTIYGGATPSTKEDKYWVDGNNHWATPRDLSGLNSKVLIDTGRKITDNGVNKISSKQLPIGTILLSSRAPVGYIAYSTVPISINQGFIAMVCKKKLSNYYIMYWLDIAMNEIKNRAIGTTFSEISKSAFRPIKLVVASDEVIISFDAIVAPMVKKLIENEREIETLQKTRDTLLPKLLSGELDVSKINTEPSKET